MKLLKYDNLWQLSVLLNNRGNENAWGLVMSVRFKDIPIIDSKEFSVFLRPGQTHVFNNIAFKK